MGRRFLLFFKKHRIVSMCVPLVVAIVFFVASYVCYINYYERIVTDGYRDKLDSFLQTMDGKISGFVNDVTTITLFSKHIASIDVRESVDVEGDEEFQERENFENRLLEQRLALQNVTYQQNILNNVIIINRKDKLVTASEDVYDMAKYFSTVCVYEKYNADFWNSYSISTGTSQFLQPSVITGSSVVSPRTITPFVFLDNSSGGDNLIVFNIDAEKVYDEFVDTDFSENALFYLLNASDNTEVCSGYSTIAHSDAASEMVEILSSPGNAFEVSTIGGEKYYILSSDRRSSIFGYKYIAAIPYSDVKKEAVDSAGYALYITAGFLLLALIYIYYSLFQNKRLWRSLVTGLNLEYNDYDDIAMSIKQKFSEIKSHSDDLQKNLAHTLPLSQQAYITNILNNNYTSNDSDLHQLIFKNDYFASVAVNISYKKTDNQMPASIISDVYAIIEQQFSARFVTFSLPSTNQSLYLLLNPEDDSCDKDILAIIDLLMSILSVDLEIIDVCIGRGHIYKGIEGMRTSHNEALNELLNAISSAKVQIVNNSLMQEYSSNLNNESLLTNYLLSGHGEKAVQFIENVFSACGNSPSQNRFEAYKSLFFAVQKVCSLKQIDLDEFDFLSKQDFWEQMTTRSEEDILQQLFRLVNFLCNDGSNRNLDIAPVVNYINDHYSDESLCLETLSSMFFISTKYLSKCLSEHLGMPFKAYITELRINEAKVLLMQQETKIMEISKKVGFYSHSAFIRSFKLKTGISPNEYRRLHAPCGVNVSEDDKEEEDI